MTRPVWRQPTWAPGLLPLQARLREMLYVLRACWYGILMVPCGVSAVRSGVQGKASQEAMSGLQFVCTGVVASRRTPGTYRVAAITLDFSASA